MITATTYFLSTAPSKYSSLPQVENAPKPQNVVELSFFAHRLGTTTSRWVSFAGLCFVALMSSLGIIVSNDLILTPTVFALGLVFVTAQTIVYLLLPQALKPQLLATHDEKDAGQLDWQRASELAGRVFGLLTIYLAISPGSFVISQPLLATAIIILIQRLSIIILVSQPLLLSVER